MAIDPTALAAEIRSDPLSLGYAAPLAAGDLVSVKALLDATTGPGAATITLAKVTKAGFLTWLTMPCLALSGASAALQGKWDRVLGLAKAHDGDFDVAVIVPLLQALQADGLTTADAIAALTTRLGSRVEVLFGAGASPSIAELTIALYGAT